MINPPTTGNSYYPKRFGINKLSSITLTTDQYCIETAPAIVVQQQEEQGQQNEEKTVALVTGAETAVEGPQTMLVYPNPNSGVFTEEHIFEICIW